MADEVVIATVDAQPLRARFPLHVELFGVAAVVIPEAEYAALTEKSRPKPRAKQTRSAFRRSRSRIDNDPEVAEFLVSCLSKLYVDEALDECRKRFGSERTPSRSSAHLFRRRLEGGAEGREGTREAP